MAGDGKSASAHLVPGYRLDRYELLCPIAEGGMASVWVARLRAKHGFEKLVAVKTILPKHAEDPRFQQMFLDEARIASRIDHVNVAHVLDLGDEHGVLYLVMEWVDGDSLSKLHRAVKGSGGQMPMGIALRIVADACAGLHAAHELRDAEGHPLHVVHRDVSPQNILVGGAGIAKVIDFGIAKARDRLAGETSTGSLKGKIQFMAPEQAVGKPIDRRADVWSTGSVLYTLLAGEPPYDETNQYATLHRIASGERPPPLPQRIPKSVAQIVERALAFEPKDRFASMADMRAAIEGVIDELSMPATTRDVSELVTLHMATRADQRKKSVELAVRAAAERDRVAKILTAAPTSEPSPAVPPAPPSRESGRSRVATVPDIPVRVLTEPPTNPSLPSLGAASMPSIPSFATTPPQSRRRVVLGVVGVSAAICLFALGRLTTSAPPEPSRAAAAPIPGASTPAPSTPAPSTPPPVVDVSELPSAAPSASASAAPLRFTPPRRPPPKATPPPPPQPPRKRPVDDGF